jgi:polygalacturonase
MVRSLYDNQTEMSFGSWEGNPLDCFAALLTAVDAENLTVMGQGIINGNADASDWWIDRTVKRIAWRPRLIFLNHCRNVTVQGLNIRNSPSWTIHPYYSSDLKFLDLTIENPYNSPNTDGFDPESCTDVLLLGTRISVGDDCVAIKSGKLYMASAHHRSSERIEIRNCLFEHGHGSVTIGSEIAGGVRDVHVSKCRFIGTDRGVRIKTRRGRGERSVLSDLLFEEILMERVNMPVTVNMHYFCDPDGHSCYVQSQEMRERDYLTPSIGTITLKNTECRDVSTSLVCACGLPESPIGHITLENITASFIPEQDRKPAVPLMMDGFEPVSGESLWLKNVVDLDVNHLNIQGENIHDPVLLTSMNMRIQDAVINWEPLRTVSQN